MSTTCVTPRSGAAESTPELNVGAKRRGRGSSSGGSPPPPLRSPSHRRFVAPLASREFRLLFLGQSVSLLGSGAGPVALSFALLASGAPISTLSLALAAQVVPLLLFLLVGGVWGDRLPRQRIMLCCDVARFTVQASLGALLMTGHLTLPALLALQAGKGVAEAFFTPAAGSLIPATVEPDQLQQANALRGLAQSAGSLAGPVLGGVLVASAGAAWALQVNAATYLISAAFLVAMRVPGPRRGEREARRPSSVLDELREGWQAVRARSWVMVIIALDLVFMTFAVAPTYVLGPLVARTSLGGAEAWGFVLASMGAGELVGGAGALWLRPRRALLAACLLTPLYSLFLALLTWRVAFAAQCAAAAGAGFSVAYFEAVWSTALQRHVPGAVLARVLSFDAVGSLAGLPVGFVLAPLLSGLLGLNEALIVCAALTGATAAVAALAPAVRRLDGGAAG